jgi:transposase-like protein
MSALGRVPSRTNNSYAPEFRAEAVRRYNDPRRRGQTLTELSAEMNVSVKTLSTWVQKDKNLRSQFPSMGSAPLRVKPPVVDLPPRAEASRFHAPETSETRRPGRGMTQGAKVPQNRPQSRTGARSYECSNCEGEYKYLRGGLCHGCDQRING